MIATPLSIAQPTAIFSVTSNVIWFKQHFYALEKFVAFHSKVA
jgi:hypothetical protein